MTSELHEAYLNLGSNIQPEDHFRKAIELLGKSGRVKAVSTVWESRAVGAQGPNFLNVCIRYKTHFRAEELKAQIIRSVESELGRVRSADKNAARTIDIDIILFDGEPFRHEYWERAFTIVPLAELLPDFIHPQTGETLSQAALRLRQKIWIKPRPDMNSTLIQTGTKR